MGGTDAQAAALTASNAWPTQLHCTLQHPAYPTALMETIGGGEVTEGGEGDLAHLLASAKLSTIFSSTWPYSKQWKRPPFPLGDDPTTLPRSQSIRCFLMGASGYRTWAFSCQTDFWSMTKMQTADLMNDSKVVGTAFYYQTEGTFSFFHALPPFPINSSLPDRERR